MENLLLIILLAVVITMFAVIVNQNYTNAKAVDAIPKEFSKNLDALQDSVNRVLGVISKNTVTEEHNHATILSKFKELSASNDGIINSVNLIHTNDSRYRRKLDAEIALVKEDTAGIDGINSINTKLRSLSEAVGDIRKHVTAPAPIAKKRSTISKS